ncbi:MAG TPA: MFS transporter [Cyclobacteriaceae bacterium]|nr:MFS transporter [Cyclobacteriaceae bacterium]
MQLTYNNPKVVKAWCMFDWANSVYNLVITTTFFPIYFLAVTKSAYGEDTVPFMGRVFKNSALYDYALAFAYLSIALLLPILSSIADSQGNKKRFMQFFTYLGGLACIGMFWFRGENVGLGIACFIFAVIGYAGGLVFYNSYLPEIAAPEDRDKISARGYAMGYIGSVILQVVGFGLVIYFSGQSGPNSKVMGPLITFLLVGLWWIGFAQITFKWLPPSKPSEEKFSYGFLTAGFIELGKVWRQVRKLSVLKWYLTSFFFYNMGVQTVMLAATMFASKMLGLPEDKLIITVVLIQLLAVAGAIIMSRLSARFGNIPVLMGVVLFWIFLCVATYVMSTLKENGQNVELFFYPLAMSVGLVMGGIQSLSRSTYSKLMPVTNDTASFFSFYDVTEKVAIVIGIFTFGYIDELLGMKNSVLSLIVFFMLGLTGLLITYRKYLKGNHELRPTDIKVRVTKSL